MIERRSITRTTISKSAKAFLNSNVLDCAVLNITNAGPGIRADGPDMLPQDFELSFDNFHTIRRCRLIWRQGDFAGVAFQN
jgi:hypothetical protein